MSVPALLAAAVVLCADLYAVGDIARASSSLAGTVVGYKQSYLNCTKFIIF